MAAPAGRCTQWLELLHLLARDLSRLRLLEQAASAEAPLSMLAAVVGVHPGLAVAAVALAAVAARTTSPRTVPASMLLVAAAARANDGSWRRRTTRRSWRPCRSSPTAPSASWRRSRGAISKSTTVCTVQYV